MPYKLSATLSSHSSDVRAICTPTNDLVLSASRDSTAIAWKRASSNSFSPGAVFRPGSRFINSVTYLHPSSADHPGFLVAGGQDCVVSVFSLDSTKDDPDFSLIGHSDNVCALDASLDGTIISGSWDKTAKVWKDFQLAHDLKGHQQSVWAVLAISHEEFLTGSADKTIKLWQQHKALRTFQGHRDAVRGLAIVPDIGFASCSNDSEIRVWTMQGDTVYTLSGHTSFVYSISVLPNGDIISGGEDRTLRVWRDGECEQSIVHPAISVWTVSAMPNGDIVSGSSDGIVRVFTTSEERWASAEDIQSYEKAVAAQALPSQQVGDLKKSDLSGPESLRTPGTKSGEVKMVKNGDIVEAYQWDSSASKWQKIGDVVDAVGQGRKQLYQGREYDYVFDVDIKDGEPPLKLPYNVTDNPFSVAQTFLQTNELPLTYIDEVVKFIEKNTAGVNIGTGGNEYVDPYTGASRYQSSSASVASSQPASSFVDPFTGASRYSGQPSSTTSTYSAPQTSSPSETVSKIIPVTQCVHFKQANITAMQNKLTQFNNDLQQQPSTSSIAMSSHELSLTDDAFASLTQILQNPRFKVALNASHVDAVIQILIRWPLSQCFPVMDLSRIMIGCFPAAFDSPGLKERFFNALFIACDWKGSWEVPASKAKETNLLLLLRAFANAFHERHTHAEEGWIAKFLDKVNQLPYSSLTKAHRVALATAAFNISVLEATQESSRTDITGLHLKLILNILQSETDDSETVYRTLVALGNIVYFLKKRNISRSADDGQGARQALSKVLQRFTEDRIKNVVKETMDLIQ